ncbi:MAG: hypothetical protein QG657_5485, partial [Acidobacteriota bacterium]|nr:hypothetical protein [Acidobacteriota bacterium]
MNQEPIEQGMYSTIKGWVEKLEKSELLAQLKIQAKNIDIDER